MRRAKHSAVMITETRAKGLRRKAISAFQTYKKKYKDNKKLNMGVSSGADLVIKIPRIAASRIK